MVLALRLLNQTLEVLTLNELQFSRVLFVLQRMFALPTISEDEKAIDHLARCIELLLASHSATLLRSLFAHVRNLLGFSNSIKPRALQAFIKFVASLLRLHPESIGEAFFEIAVRYLCSSEAIGSVLVESLIVLSKTSIHIANQTLHRDKRRRLDFSDVDEPTTKDWVSSKLLSLLESKLVENASPSRNPELFHFSERALRVCLASPEISLKEKIFPTLMRLITAMKREIGRLQDTTQEQLTQLANSCGALVKLIRDLMPLAVQPSPEFAACIEFLLDLVENQTFRELGMPSSPGGDSFDEGAKAITNTVAKALIPIASPTSVFAIDRRKACLLQALRDQRPAVASAAIQALPFLLKNAAVGRQDVLGALEELVSTSTPPEVQLALASSVGSFMCAYSQSITPPSEVIASKPIRKPVKTRRRSPQRRSPSPKKRASSPRSSVQSECEVPEHVLSVPLPEIVPLEQENVNERELTERELAALDRTFEEKFVCGACRSQSGERKGQLSFQSWRVFFRFTESEFSEQVQIAFLQNLICYATHLKLDPEIAASTCYMGRILEMLWLSRSELNVKLFLASQLELVLDDCGRKFFGATGPGLIQFALEKLDAFDYSQLSSADAITPLLMAIAALGAVGSKDHVTRALDVLVEHFWNSSLMVRARVQEQIAFVARKRQLSIPNMFRQCKSLFDHILERVAHDPRQVKDFCVAVFSQKVKEFLPAEVLPFALPQHVMREETRNEVVDSVAQLLNKSRSELLKEYISDILSYSFLTTSSANVMEYLLENTGLNPKAQCEWSMGKLLNNLVAALAEPSKRGIVEKALRYIAQPDQNGGASGEQLAEFLGKHMIGIMYNIESQLNKPDLSEKVAALSALSALFSLLGSSLRVWTHIANVLKIAARQRPLQLHVCEAYTEFLRRLDSACLRDRKLVAQIFLDLSPCLNSSEQSIRSLSATIFTQLVSANKDAIREHLAVIPELPRIPELEAAHKMLDQSTKRLELGENLKALKKAIANSSPEMRVQSLKQLLIVLEKNRGQIYRQLLSERSKPLSKLVAQLVIGASHAKQRESQLIAEALGLIGAIDPGRLDVLLKGGSELGTELDELQLGKTLVTDYLVRSVNSKDHARAAYSIQEVLRCMRCPGVISSESPMKNKPRTKALSPTSEKDKGSKFWASLDVEVQECVQPYLTSNFTTRASSIQRKEMSLFSSHENYQKWLTEWVISLVHRSETPRGALFRAVSVTIKDDQRVAMFLLPHVILDILKHCQESEHQDIKKEFLAVLSVHEISLTPLKAKSEARVEFIHRSTQCIFYLLDWLQAWASTKRQSIRRATSAKPEPPNQARLAAARRIPELSAVENLLDCIPELLIAQGALRCQSYLRALMHYEAHLRSPMWSMPSEGGLIGVNPALNNAEALSFLQKIYAGLEDADGLQGVAQLRLRANVELPLIDRIAEEASQGRFSQAMALCDQALQNVLQQSDQREQAPGEGSSRVPLLRMYLGTLRDLGLLSSMDAVIAVHNPGMEDPLLNSFGVQAAWRLGKWNMLKEFDAKSTKSTDFEVYLGRLLLLLKEGNLEKFHHDISDARAYLMSSLAAASMDSYQRCYPIITRLHMLHEIQQVFTLIRPQASAVDAVRAQSSTAEAFANLTEIWDLRLKGVQESFKAQEPLVSVRCVLSGLLPQGSGVDYSHKSWLQLAKISRNSGYLEVASNALTKLPRTARVAASAMERIKLMRDQDQCNQAIVEIGKVLGNQDLFKEDAMLKAKATLLLGRLLENAGYERQQVALTYANVTHIMPQWEKGYFYLARFYDALLRSSTQRESAANVSLPSKKNSAFLQVDRNVYQTEFMEEAMKNYALALRCGHVFIHQSLPRLLTIWFDVYGLPSKTLPPSAVAEARRRIRRDSEKWVHELPVYQWLLCFSQLISRVSHQNTEIIQQLHEIVSKVLVTYPGQALWLVMILRLDHVGRRNELFKKCTAINPRIEEIELLCKNLIDMAKSARKPNELLSHQIFSIAPTRCIVPIRTSFSVKLPESGVTEVSFDPFATPTPLIRGFVPRVKVMSSLQKPKQIAMLGDDGKEYKFLAKTKDDLRKDARVQEFDEMINKLLKKDPEARRRHLRIRTYGVVPLTPSCGLIEWVEGTIGLRFILEPLYHASDFAVAFDKERIRHLNQANNKLSEADRFTKVILPACGPPRLHAWFLNTFKDKSAWYEARVSYTRTVAVMSMVGAVIGLGDRHLENILLDQTNGEVLHVDLNCLFYKGLTFETPERVPFRLTSNILDGMGFTKHEGAFRRVCEIAMRIMRNHREILMSVLETFVHDPFSELSRHAKKKKESDDSDSEAELLMRRLRYTLEGQVDFGPPLTIEGQVENQIKAASDPENLNQMYYGWMAWV